MLFCRCIVFDRCGYGDFNRFCLSCFWTVLGFCFSAKVGTLAIEVAATDCEAAIRVDYFFPANRTLEGAARDIYLAGIRMNCLMQDRMDRAAFDVHDTATINDAVAIISVNFAAIHIDSAAVIQDGCVAKFANAVAFYAVELAKLIDCSAINV